MGKSKIHDLTDKQVFFCREYLIDLNGTQAAIRAGYSEDSAKEIAYEHLTKPHILEYIEVLKKQRAEKLEITAERVLLELGKCGFSDLADFVNEDYKLKPISELADKSKAIQSIQTDEFTSEAGYSKTVKFKLHDKLAALEKIAKHIGFFEKDNAQQNKVIITPLSPDEYKKYDDETERKY